MGEVGIGSAGLGGYPVAYAETATQQVGRIHDGLATQEKLVMAIHEEIASLEQRISAFLRPTPPDNAGQGPNTVQATPSAVGQALEKNNIGFSQAIQRLRALTARVDI